MALLIGMYVFIVGLLMLMLQTPPEEDVIPWLIKLIIGLGAPWVAVKLFDWLESEPVLPFLEKLPYVIKYILSSVVGVAVMTVIWLLGMFVFGVYTPLEAGSSANAWINNWANTVIPIPILQQFWYGIDKTVKAKKAKATVNDKLRL